MAAQVRLTRPPRGITKVAIVVGASAVTAGVLWTAGFPPKSWLSPSRAPRTQHAADLPAADPKPSASPSVQQLAGDMRAAFPGTESSTSIEPRALILTGTILGKSPHDGVAFIGVDARNPQTYSAGAILVNGARLAEIAASHVVLERGGVSVRLYAQNTKGQAGPPSDLLMVGAPASFVPARSTNNEVFTEFIRPNPVYNDDSMVGYEVYAGQKGGGVFSRLGLQPGDVITAFDGVPITDSNMAMEIFQQLATGITLSATVKRKGAVQHVTLDGSIVAAEVNRSNDTKRAAVPAGPAAPNL